SWGGSLRATLSFTARALALDASDFFFNRMRTPVGGGVEAGATLRLQLGGGAAVIRRIARIVEDWNPLDGSRQTWAWFDAPTPGPAQSAEVVDGVLAVDDDVNPTETHDR